MDFCAGYLSGAIGIIVGNPLDILKVKIQSSTSATASPTSAVPSLPQTPPSSTHRRTLFKGVAAPILTYGALNALLFATYNRALPLFSPTPADPTPPTQHPYPAHFLSGLLAGLATFIISTPTELIKCRAQLALSTPPHSSAHIARAILARHGPAGLYHGGVVTALRDGIGYGFYFLAYEASKDAWTAQRAGRPPPAWDEAAKIVVCGGLAGVVTWASVFPLDVIKSRVQTHAAFLPAGRVLGGGVRETQPLLAARGGDGAARAPGAWAMMRLAYRTEGMGVFFRGLGVCSVRAFIVNAVQWSVYELVMKTAAGETRK